MFGKYLRLYRLEKGMGKGELARLAGLSPRTISACEKEGRRLDMATILLLADTRRASGTGNATQN